MQKQGITTKIKCFIPVLLLSLTLLFCLTTVSAADNNTIYVNDTGGNDSWDGTSWATAKLSIKNATGTINTNGTIHIANGQYTGENNTNIIISKNMSIIGESQTGTIINGTGTNWIFTVSSDITVTIQNLTITNGTRSDYGGAIYNIGNLTVSNCTFTGNTANNVGGAIWNGGNCTINSSTFINNTAGWGGAVYNNMGITSIGDCTFTNNNAGGSAGGAVYNYQGTITNLSGCTFTGNNAYFGGAIINYQSTITNLSGCTFTGNNATVLGNSALGNGYGGAIYNYQGTITNLSDCNFTNNTAGFGGAIWNEGTITNLSSCTFTDNTATGWNEHYRPGNYGGAICNDYGGTLNVTGSAFTGNTASNGGAIWNNGTCTLNFNRIVDNTAAHGNAIYSTGSSVDAENNWWGTNNPNTNWDSFISGFNHPNWWIYMNLTADPSNILYGGNSTLTADFNYLYNGTDITVLDPLNGHIPDGSPVSFTTTLESIDPAFTTTVNGVAKSIFTPITVGSVTINAKMDDQTCPLTFTVGKGIPNVSVAEVHNFAGQTVNLIANVKDQNNNPVNQGQVTFKVGNDDLGTVNVINGIAKIDNWLIPASWSAGNYTILVNYIENNNYTASSGTGNLTVDKTPTNLTIDNISGNKGKTVTLKATLKDYYGTPINNKTVEFYVNNVKVGENTTDTNGLAAFNYNIDLIGGAYNITAKFTGDTEYLASNDNGTLKVNQSSVYVLTTASKTNPTVGETITLNFKLGNNGPDPADDVVFTYVIPDGMEFVSLETEPGYPEAAYNPETRTITWNLGTVPKLDPWLKLNVKVLKSGIFNVNPAVITSVYDPALGSNIQFVTVNAVQAASAASTVTSTTRSIGMQETGLPIPLLVLAILMVLGGSLVPKRK